jgi:hypothetical protein
LQPTTAHDTLGAINSSGACTTSHAAPSAGLPSVIHRSL